MLSAFQELSMILQSRLYSLEFLSAIVFDFTPNFFIQPPIYTTLFLLYICFSVSELFVKDVIPIQNVLSLRSLFQLKALSGLHPQPQSQVVSPYSFIRIMPFPASQFHSTISFCIVQYAYFFGYKLPEGKGMSSKYTNNDIQFSSVHSWHLVKL